MIFSYLTIDSPQEGLLKEKGSRFLSFAIPVGDETQVKQQLDLLRKKYFDARHHCYAYMLGAEQAKFRANDDGEPNHSAGDPILGQIRSKNITNVLVVVVRYFGGVKLGVGGLISAYKTAAEDALNKCEIIEKEIYEQIEVRYTYGCTPDVMKLVKDFHLQIADQTFDESCKLIAAYRLRVKADLFEKIRLLKATGHQLEVV